MDAIKDYIDLEDIQGNVVKGYGRYGYPIARYLFFTFTNPNEGREFVKTLEPLITNGTPWANSESLKPKATTNIAFSYEGLKQLGLPNASLHSFPDEFATGMKARKIILGDDKKSAPEHWDDVWDEDKSVHMWLSINAIDQQSLIQRYEDILKIKENHKHAVQLLKGHQGIKDGKPVNDLPYQDAGALTKNGAPIKTEHFGFVDGISDPYFKGSGANPINVIGGGKPTREDPKTKEGWTALETGEFILGYKDEAQELPKAPMPRLLGFNGTYMVYRKLHQNVKSFQDYLGNLAKDYEGGEKKLAAKMAGRWPNGAPISEFPTEQQADEFILSFQKSYLALKNAKQQGESSETISALQTSYDQLKLRFTAFNFDGDISGGKCPMGSHIRRMNPRGALEFGNDGAFNQKGALADRRRILRRGLPYGSVDDDASDEGNHGIVFMAIGASIKRQFEFVQQQWANYGNDFKLANQKDPLIGNHSGDDAMIVESDQKGEAPFFCPSLPRMVETRGGEYFFVPSITAIRMIADGIVDPT